MLAYDMQPTSRFVYLFFKTDSDITEEIRDKEFLNMFYPF